MVTTHNPANPYLSGPNTKTAFLLSAFRAPRFAKLKLQKLTSNIKTLVMFRFEVFGPAQLKQGRGVSRPPSYKVEYITFFSKNKKN